MAFTATKLTELPLMRTSLPHLTCHHHHHHSSLFSSTTQRYSLHIPKLPFSSSLNNNKTPTWLSKWAPPNQHPPPHPPAPPPTAAQSSGHQSTASAPAQTHYLSKDRGLNAIERIVLRLRNLGLGSDGEEEVEEGNEVRCEDVASVTGEERLGELLQREWIRPDTILNNRTEDDDDEDEFVLPWERKEEERHAEGIPAGREKRRTVKAPTLAELTIEDDELRRLRKMGMFLRERISIPKAGLTKVVLENIHDKWRKEELVRLKFHEVLAKDMKTAHEIVEVGC